MQTGETAWNPTGVGKVSLCAGLHGGRWSHRVVEVFQDRAFVRYPFFCTISTFPLCRRVRQISDALDFCSAASVCSRKSSSRRVHPGIERHNETATKEKASEESRLKFVHYGLEPVTTRVYHRGVSQVLALSLVVVSMDVQRLTLSREGCFQDAHNHVDGRGCFTSCICGLRFSNLCSGWPIAALGDAPRPSFPLTSDISFSS